MKFGEFGQENFNNDTMLVGLDLNFKNDTMLVGSDLGSFGDFYIRNL